MTASTDIMRDAYDNILKQYMGYSFSQYFSVVLIEFELSINLWPEV